MCPPHIVCGPVKEYPRDLPEFERMFPTDDACRRYLGQLRWPEGFRCPRCQNPKAWDLLPRVHRVVGLLKRWLLGTHQGGVSAEHLDYYLDEFTFWFNRRRSRHGGKLFYRLAQQAVAIGPHPFKELVNVDHNR